MPKVTPSIALRSVSVSSSPEANANSVTTVEVVLVYNSAMIALLPRSAPEWFAGKTRILAEAAKEIDVVSLQIPPGMSVVSVTLPKRLSKAVGAYVYADYRAPAGQVPITLTAYRTVALRLRKASILVTQVGERAAPRKPVKRAAAAASTGKAGAKVASKTRKR